MSLSLKLYKNKQLWDNFIASSPQKNIFCTTPFLDALGKNYRLLLVEQNNRPQIGAVVLEQKDQPIRPPYPYQGLLFHNSLKTMPNYSRVRFAQEAVEFLLAKMQKKYNRIYFCLHYNFEDLRSFQWFHYHEPEKGKFKISLQYTGLIKLKEFSNFKNFLKTIRKVRRYEYRQAIKTKLKVEPSQDIDQLDYLHELTFKRQKIRRSKTTSQNLKNIAKAALSQKFGELLLCKTPKGKALSATLFLYDKKCGYYLIGANHPRYRHTGSGTFLLLENIRHCFKKKLDLIDVCGINSPNRGDFKTSFNAKPTPYFVVTWEKPLK